MTSPERKLPAERQGVTHRFTILVKVDEKDGGGVREAKGYVSTGVFPDGKLAEIFIKLGKSGEQSAVYDQWAICASIALQHGFASEIEGRDLFASKVPGFASMKNLQGENFQTYCESAKVSFQPRRLLGRTLRSRPSALSFPVD